MEKRSREEIEKIKRRIDRIILNYAPEGFKRTILYPLALDKYPPDVIKRRLEEKFDKSELVEICMLYARYITEVILSEPNYEFEEV